MRLLVLDNYDSFTYNLVHVLREIGGCTMDVIRNDKLTLDQVAAYDKILLSPGPGIPSEAGLMPALIERYAPTHSILGICLGHQAIAEAFGGHLLNLATVMHGRESMIRLETPHDRLFAGLPAQIQAGRYHSWVVDPEHLPQELEATAWTQDGQIMALRHRTYDVRGIQFHPESVMTPDGRTMLENWLRPAT